MKCDEDDKDDEVDKDDEDEDIRLDEVEFRKLFEDRLVSFDLLTSKYSNRPPF